MASLETSAGVKKSLNEIDAEAIEKKNRNSYDQFITTQQEAFGSNKRSITESKFLHSEGAPPAGI